MTTELETQREYAWRVYPHDAKNIPERIERRRCNQAGCGAPIWWGFTAANNKRCPFDIKPDGEVTGTSHWRTCRNRPERSKGGQSGTAKG